MTDDWEQRITQLGLTKTTHEYAIYQLFSTAVGWSAWKEFLPDRFANLKLLITRAIRLLTAATIRPPHARPPPHMGHSSSSNLQMLPTTRQTVVGASVLSPSCDSFHPRWHKRHWCSRVFGWIVHWIGYPQSAQWVRLLPRYGCVLARSRDSCTHESEERNKLTDTSCVLARGCDSCTRESEVMRSETADMGCVLARGCDSCTHEPCMSVAFGSRLYRLKPRGYWVT